MGGAYGVDVDTGVAERRVPLSVVPVGSPLGWPDALVAVIILAAAVTNCWQYWHLDLDDAFISLRYADNLRHGLGWVYNRGEAVNAATSPLYVLILAALGTFIGDLPAVAHVVGGVGLAACAWCVYLLLRPRGHRVAGVLAALLILSCPLLPKTYGMETLLYLGLAAAALYLYHSGRTAASGAALGLLILTRYDGVLLGVVLGAHYLATKRRVPVRAICVAAALVLPWVVFSVAAFGSPLPGTLEAKLAQGASGLWPAEFLAGGPFWARQYLVQSVWFYAMLPLSGAGLLAMILYRREYLTLPLWGGLHYASYSLLRVPYYHWYYAPTALVLVVLAASSSFLAEGRRRTLVAAAAWLTMLVAMAVLTQTVLRRSPAWEHLSLLSAGILLPGAFSVSCAVAAIVVRRRPGLSRRLLAVGAIAPLLAAQAASSWAFPALPHTREDAYRKVGMWLQQHTASGSTVATREIGVIGYYSRRRVLDFLGLVTPEARRQVARGNFTWWLRRCRPDYVVVRRPPGGFERPALLDPFFVGRYRIVKEIPQAHYGTMVIYRRVGDTEASPPHLVQAAKRAPGRSGRVAQRWAAGPP